MKWEVTGAWKVDGNECTMIVEAANQRAAEAIASQRGMVVEQAIPQVATAVPVVTGDGYRITRRVFGIIFCIAAPFCVLTGDPIYALLGTVGGIGWLAMVLAK